VHSGNFEQPLVSPARQAAVRVACILGTAWVLPLPALLSGSNVAMGLFFSAHGGFAPLIYLIGNIAAVVTSVSRIAKAAPYQRPRVVGALLAVWAVFALLAYPYSALLQSRLSIFSTGSVWSFYAVLAIPFSWLFRP
jgi:hypothetical protein